MELLEVMLVLLAIGALVLGPVAFILTLTLLNRVGKLEEKLRERMTGRPPEAAPRPAPLPFTPPMPAAAPPIAPPVAAAMAVSPKAPPSVAAESHWPVQVAPPQVEKSIEPAPIMPLPLQMPSPKPPTQTPPTAKPIKPAVPRVGLEEKIGTTVALIAGIITVIVGVGFFLKYVYEHAYFGPTARVCMVAAGGLTAMLIGEITRRRGYEIVAKGVTAMGFALLYVAVFSASRVYMLIETQTAFVLAMAITAGAMTYAVALNEVVIAWLSLLGGYLSPIIISTGQNLAMPLFSYLLALGLGALGCAMFRRWRAVNWIALVGTYLLFTGWFEKFYTPAQMTLTLTWLGVFGGMFLVQPILYGVVRKVAARAEDVGLVVANSVAVFYYLWRILYAVHPQAQAIAAATVGLAHLALMAAVILRCRQDRKLQAALGVLGTAFLTTAIPLYFSALNPTLLSWSVEAVALTFIGIRYRSVWTKTMAFIVGAIATAGLFYHLPLHGDETFKIIFNASFGTWLFVSAALLVCHALWRFLAEAQNEEGRFSMQLYYGVGIVLMAAGCVLEWSAYCDRFIENSQHGQSALLLGIIGIAAALTAVLLARPLCPKGDLVRMAGMMAALAGSIYTAIAMMGVYHEAFRLFANRPFAIACGYAVVVLLCAWWVRRLNAETPSHKPWAAVLGMMGLALVFVLLAEQGYSYWYCRNAYSQPIADWQASAAQTVAISWAVYALFLLAAALRFDKLWLKAAAVLSAGLSAAVLLLAVPLHTGGAFRFMQNLPFTAWVAVAAALLAGHGLWRLIKTADANESRLMAQVYYAAGVLLAAAGWTMEWQAHCRWQVAGRIGDANFLLGMIVLLAAMIPVFLVRPLTPRGLLVRTLGVLTGLAGAVFVVCAMEDVHTTAFALFFNLPFGIAAVFVAAMMEAVRRLRQVGRSEPQWLPVASAMLLAGLVLVWILLSQEVYYYWACRNTYAGPVDNWRFSSQMYMSVAWAIYAAALMVGGFAFRVPSVRYLSLALFTVLLAKIFLKDTTTLRVEYRIAAFLTTGLILVGVSFLYQFLKKKGFFETLENKQIKESQTTEKGSIL